MPALLHVIALFAVNVLVVTALHGHQYLRKAHQHNVYGDAEDDELEEEELERAQETEFDLLPGNVDRQRNFDKDSIYEQGYASLQTWLTLQILVKHDTFWSSCEGYATTIVSAPVKTT
ncbi:hypothetical protein AAVH_39686, partial [Aphelenchoides avenae]